MSDWFDSLYDPTFMPHGHCYLWRPDILWTHIISDIVIGMTYYIIPIFLAILLFKRKQRLPHADIFGLFTAFIFFCGTTHFVAIYVTWYPAYEYQGWLKALTAFTSLLTVIVLAPKLPALLQLTSVEMDYQENKLALDVLLAEKNKMNAIYSSTLDREERIIELKNEVNQLLAEKNRPLRYKNESKK